MKRVLPTPPLPARGRLASDGEESIPLLVAWLIFFGMISIVVLGTIVYFRPSAAVAAAPVAAAPVAAAPVAAAPVAAAPVAAAPVAAAPVARQMWAQVMVTSHLIQYSVGAERGHKRIGPEPLDPLRAFSGKIYLEGGLVPSQHLNDGTTIKEVELALSVVATKHSGDPAFDGYLKIVVDRRAAIDTVGQVVNTARFAGFIKPDVVVAPNDLEDGLDVTSTWSDPESI